MKKRCTAIVLAAGSGKRMRSGTAKQYLKLGHKPMICHALQAVEDSSVIDDCILVTAPADIEYVQKEVVEKYDFHKVNTITAGGKERYDSVYHALRVIAGGDMEVSNKEGYVFIHDGARPFLTEKMLKECYTAVQKYDACVMGVPVKDTIKIVDSEGFAVGTPNRNTLWQVQTPQVFAVPLIIEAYEKLMQEKANLQEDGVVITDDAMVVETMMRHPVKLVQGSYENIKITTPEDLQAAEAFLGWKK